MRYDHRLLLSAAVFMGLGTVTSANSVFAQGLFGSQGAVGQTAGQFSSGSQIGSTSSLTGGRGTTTGGQGGGMFGGQSLGGGQSGFGQQGGFGGTGTGFGSQLGQSGAGNTGFIGQQNAQGRFVGNQQVGQGGAGQFQGGRQTAQFGNRQNQRAQRNNAGQFGGGQFGGGQVGSTQQTVIRPRLEIAFSAPRPTAAVVGQRLNTRFGRLAANSPVVTGIQAAAGNDGVVVLSGSVASEDAKKLAAIMAGLEPGVRSVQNNLVVQPAPQ